MDVFNYNLLFNWHKCIVIQLFLEVKPFDEVLWAELEDARTLQVDVSLKLIEALHKRWAVLLGSLSATELNRQFCHPENGYLSLKVAIGLYAWHGNHHLAHITNYRKSIGL